MVLCVPGFTAIVNKNWKMVLRQSSQLLLQKHGIDSKGVVWEFLVKRTSTHLELRSAYPIFEKN